MNLPFLGSWLLIKKKMSVAELVEVVSVIGLFNYINRFNNTFAILPK